jgi:murein DD-endopeptidase MepM/ murein hydrolase activator NlpD
MMKKLPILSGLAAFLAITGMLCGCASSLKEYNPKMGLLDELVELEPANQVKGSTAESSVAASAASEDTEEETNARPAVAVNEERARSPKLTKAMKDVTMSWPLKEVQITSPYGQRGNEFHEGVDLRAAVGTPVYAAHAGHVLYAGGKLHGYGNMIVIKHSSGIATIYAHNSKLVVRQGQWVRQGTLIAYTGNTGHSHGPHLHFEIRDGVQAVNPMKLLPKPGRLSGAGKLLAG